MARCHTNLIKYFIFVVIFSYLKFIQMKKNLRTVHINDKEWKWVVESLNYCTIKEIRIYSPEKKMWRVKPEELSTVKTYEEYAGDEYFIIQPQMVKNYIESKILNP